jgi:hypothetical protein
MEKLRLIVQKSLLLVSFSVVAIFTTQAQMECRSILGAHLTPFSKNVPILWAIEGTMAPGYMTSPFEYEDNTFLAGGMIIGALDFTIAKKHNLYFEGGYKNWKNSSSEHTGTDRNLFGMRQAYYSLTYPEFNLKLGLHETNFGNFYLLDERILGASANKSIGAFTINLRGGTISKNFARMGKFCANRHLYTYTSNNIIRDLGQKPFETNLFGISLNLDPNKLGSADADEQEFSEFSSFDNNNQTFVNNTGLIFYGEFGSKIHDLKLYYGAQIDFSLPLEVVFQTSVIYQNMKRNNTIVVIANLYRNFLWSSGAGTYVGGAFMGKFNIDENATYQPLSSNLFLGEIMRLDAPQFPLWKAEVKHSFAGKQKITIAFKTVGQVTDNQTNEQDLEFSARLFHKHLKLTAILSRVESNVFSQDVYMARVEARLAF